MSAPTIEGVAPSKIPAVKAFMKALDAIRELEEQYPDAFEKFRALAAVHNLCGEAASKVVRSLCTAERGVTTGPWDLYQYRPKYDAAVLYEAVGRQKFVAMGGIIASPETRDIDKERFVALVAAETVPPELAARVTTYTPIFHEPKPIFMPKSYR